MVELFDSRGDARTNNDSGTTIVEFALVLPLLICFLLAIFTGGNALDHKMELTKAAREAARYGASLAENQCVPTSNCGGSTWAQVVRAVAIERSNGNVAQADACVALVSGPGSAPVAVDGSHTTAGGTSPCYVDNSADTGKRVQVKVHRTDELQAFFFTKTLDLNANSTAKFEQ